MLEAVNSVLSNAPITKSATQTIVKPQEAAKTESENVKVSGANYSSRQVSLDSESRRAVLQIRDSATGDPVRQFPTEGQLKAYNVAQSLLEE